MTDMVSHADTTRADAALIAFGRLVIVVLLLTISPLALVMFGWQYDDTGGGPLEKIHPATSLALLVFAASLAQRGNPLTALSSVLSSHARAIPFLLGIGFMIVYSMLVIGAPFTMFIETFLGPLLMFFLYDRIDDGEARLLARVIHALLFVNALLGIYEFVFAYHLTPLVVNGELLAGELRSTALLGHPLANAAVVGCYIFMLALGGGRDIPPSLKLTCFVVNTASMVVFGGRAATALVLIALVIIALRRLLGALRGEPFDLRAIKMGVVAAPVAALAIAGLAEYGFFDTFLDRIVDDEGSASTRIAMFELFNHFNWTDLIFAPDAKQVATWSSIYGLDYGIENFIVAFILTFGIFATVVFMPALLLFCSAVVRSLRPGGVWVFVYFFAVAMTSVSLSSKTPLFSTLIVLMMVLMRRHPAMPWRHSSGLKD